MRLPDVEQKLQSLAKRRWGEHASRLRVELEPESGRLRIRLPNGLCISSHRAVDGPVLPEAYRLLARYVIETQKSPGE